MVNNRRSEKEVRNVLYQLENSKLTIPLIAKRTGCKEAMVNATNRRYGVRQYNGKKNSWTVLSTGKFVEAE